MESTESNSYVGLGNFVLRILPGYGNRATTLPFTPTPPPSVTMPCTAKPAADRSWEDDFDGLWCDEESY